ncbi:hypothetical protein BDR05DRAFT_950094 [Suillus weaverae]|nr:hypothetical protein BDR05DRAFT_950094 [Suillus weaverae]
MLRWLVCVVLALTAGVLVFTNPLKFHRKPGYAPPRPSCQAHAWVRTPDMVPDNVIAGDARVKLDGPCTEVKSYKLGLHYKEKIFWKLRTLDRIRTCVCTRKNGLPFEIKTPLVGAKGAQSEFNLESRFVVKKLYESIRNSGAKYKLPSGIRLLSWCMGYMGDVESSFRFTSTEDEASSVNVSLTPVGLSWNSRPWERSVDGLWSNYTVEVSFPEGAHLNPNSSMNITVTGHRTAYTNRTDIPVELLCVSSKCH